VVWHYDGVWSGNIMVGGMPHDSGWLVLSPLFSLSFVKNGKQSNLQSNINYS